MHDVSATAIDAALNATTGRGGRAQPFEPAAVRYIKLGGWKVGGERYRAGNDSLRLQDCSRPPNHQGIPATASSAGDPPPERNPSSPHPRFSKGIIASVRFSHSLGQNRKSSMRDITVNEFVRHQ